MIALVGCKDKEKRDNHKKYRDKFFLETSMLPGCNSLIQAGSIMTKRAPWV